MRVGIDKTLETCWDIYFCLARAYDTTDQAEDVKLFILSTMAMISKYSGNSNYITLTVLFFNNTECYDNNTFKKLCPDSDSLFDWMVRYYNFVRGNLSYKLKSKEELDEQYKITIMTKSWWGSRVWDLIHIFAAYAPQDCTYDYYVCYRAFIVTLSKVLPCHDCRGHLLRNLQTLPMDNYATNRLSLFSWSFKLHNIVSQQINEESVASGKPATMKLFTWEQAVEKYYPNPSSED